MTVRLSNSLAFLTLISAIAFGCGGDDPDDPPQTTPEDMGVNNDIDSGGTNDDAGMMTDEEMGSSVCDAGERVESGMCVACAPGTTRMAGDDPSGADTQCEPVLCEANERVEDNQCVPCDNGEISDAGADASGPDTSCFVEDDCFAVLGVDCESVEAGYFKGDPSVDSGFFGISVAMSDDGNTLVAASPYVGTGTNPAAGIVYVFNRVDGGPWGQQDVLYPSSPSNGDEFGRSVDIDGDTIVVGAWREDSGAASPGSDTAQDSGALYVFERTGDTWTEEAFLKASSTVRGNEFGRAVAIDGDTIAASAWKEDNGGSAGADGGEVYVFEKSDGTWNETQAINAPNIGNGDLFGISLALDQDTLVVGADREDGASTGVGGDPTNLGTTDSGAAYVFVRDAGSWSLEAYLKASNSDEGDRFGYQVALAGDTLAVASIDEESAAAGVGGDQDDNTRGTGAVFVFTRDNGTWTQQEYFKAFNNTPSVDSLFGQSLALSADGQTLAVGAVLEASGSEGINGNQDNTNALDSGAVYLFQQDGAGNWGELAYVKPPNTHPQQRFGQDLAMSADASFLFVGAHWENGSASGIDGDSEMLDGSRRGAGYLFQIAP